MTRSVILSETKNPEKDMVKKLGFSITLLKASGNVPLIKWGGSVYREGFPI